MKEVKPTELSLIVNFRLSKMMSPQTEMEAQEMERVSYISGVKSLMHIMVCCRSNITHVVSQVSRFMRSLVGSTSEH